MSASADMQQVLQQIAQQLSAIQTQVTKLETQVTKLETKVTTLETKVTTIQESQQRLEDTQQDLRNDIIMFVEPLCSLRAVPEDAATATAKGTQWHNQELSRYHLQETGAYCAVLSQVCKVEPADAASQFPAVAEHIVPQDQAAVAANWGFHCTDKRNGIFLLCDLQLKHQAVRFSLIRWNLPKTTPFVCEFGSVTS